MLINYIAKDIVIPMEEARKILAKKRGIGAADVKRKSSRVPLVIHFRPHAAADEAQQRLVGMLDTMLAELARTEVLQQMEGSHGLPDKERG